MAISLEHTQRLAEIRALVLSGEQVSLEILREGFEILRQDRKSAAIASSSSKAAKAPVDTGALLAGLRANAMKITGA
jgi:hypothetical protein